MRNIIKVAVNDIEALSHSDEAIVDVLRHFVIKIVDWRKIDLCPSVFQLGCRYVREVYLSWSGNNGILRAWSKPDGLVKAPYLEAIVLGEFENLESEEKTAQNIEQFKQRIKQNRIHLNKKRKREGEAGFPDIRRSYQWLQVMDTFADGIFKIKNNIGKDADNLPYIYEVASGQVMTALQNLPGAGRPFRESATGRGTLVARLICRLWPSARIFVHRLNVDAAEGSKAHFTANSAAQAVTYASNCRFDIVSMSWTIQSRSTSEGGNSDDIEDLRRALKEAVKNGALLFCASPDEGSLTPVSFRSSWFAELSKSMLKIGAPTINNIATPRAGRENQLDYILPGHEVPDRDDQIIQVNEDSLRTEPSPVATALAAGLAALIIHCVRVGTTVSHRAQAARPNRQADPNGIGPEQVRDIKQFANMKKVLDRFAQGGCYVDVGDKFDKTGKALKDATKSDQNRLDIVARLARDLIS
ncbi:hypothetical protein B0H63DRAFT_551451 [Podospora didyma]|uniref:Peptidase S8/S53 domain-containing protein n=1 Tax=Podospora didyma TaxID=330526 RepID=A0AAE0K9K5_9PEZI|nr:hypothetical protein B0H63DRAFT_551451 [Podospora didyma]